MAVGSVNSGVQNAINTIAQSQKQETRAKEMKSDNGKVDDASRLALKTVDLQKATEQKVVVEKSDAQKMDAQKADQKKTVVQTASRGSVNTRGEIVGSNIDTQA